MRDTEAVLAVAALRAWYGESQALHGVDLRVGAGEIVTILGRNGAGKTTTLRAIMGLPAVRRVGSVAFRGEQLVALPSYEIARRGLGYCPEERGIFASLSVAENLELPPVIAPGGMTTAQLFELFPNLRERLGTSGGKLSGGEQQMLAIARILRTGARFLLLDEPTEGLAPVIVQQIRATLALLKERGFTILLVEQSLAFARAVAERHYVLENGRVVDQLAREDLAGEAGAARLRAYLGA